uniref:Transmembrane protein 14C n=1 Tax=Cyprinus carpio TaxID=7962 RepID=A0A8C2GSU7_CYPCA
MSHVPLPAAGSVISLVAGLMFGIAAFVGAHQMSKNDKDIWVSLGTCGSLTALMGVRFLSLWKIMPAGLMAASILLRAPKSFNKTSIFRPHKWLFFLKHIKVYHI